MSVQPDTIIIITVPPAGKSVVLPDGMTNEQGIAALQHAIQELSNASTDEN
jgi:hypothetical protein